MEPFQEWSELDKKKAASVSSSASEVEGSRKSSRAGKGRNPRLERDDEEVGQQLKVESMQKFETFS